MGGWKNGKYFSRAKGREKKKSAIFTVLQKCDREAREETPRMEKETGVYHPLAPSQFIIWAYTRLSRPQGSRERELAGTNGKMVKNAPDVTLFHLFHVSCRPEIKASKLENVEKAKIAPGKGQKLSNYLTLMKRRFFTGVLACSKTFSPYQHFGNDSS